MGTADGSGIAELAAAIEAHRLRAWSGPAAVERAKARAGAHLAELVRALLADRVSHLLAARGGLAEIAEAVVERQTDPWSVAEQLVDAL